MEQNFERIDDDIIKYLIGDENVCDDFHALIKRLDRNKSSILFGSIISSLNVNLNTLQIFLDFEPKINQ